MRERETIRDGTEILLFVVLGRPHLLVELERLLFVERDGRRRDVVPALRHGLLERGEIDERFEHRSWLPARKDGAVVLRLVVRAAAHKREDFARPRIERNQRHFRLTAFAL